MFGESTLAEAVGLRHVIEDGLAILEGRSLDKERREFVVRDLRKLLAEAVRGSEIASGPRLFLGETDRQAFGSFAMFGRYLKLTGADDAWRRDLPAALRAFDSLQRAESDVEQNKEAATKILSAMLTQVSIDPSAESEFTAREFDTK